MPVSPANRLAKLLVLLISSAAGKLRLPTSRIVIVMAEEDDPQDLAQIAQLIFFGEMDWELNALSFFWFPLDASVFGSVRPHPAVRRPDGCG